MKRILCVLTILLAFNSCSTHRYEKIEYSFNDCLANAIYYGDGRYELVVYDGLLDENLELIGSGAIASISLLSPHTNVEDFPIGKFSTEKSEINIAKIKHTFLNKTYTIEACSAFVLVEKDDNDNYKLNLTLYNGTKSYYFSYLGSLKLETMKD